METVATERTPPTDIDTVISEHAQELSEKLQAHRLEFFHQPLRKPCAPFKPAKQQEFWA